MLYFHHNTLLLQLKVLLVSVLMMDLSSLHSYCEFCNKEIRHSHNFKLILTFCET